MGVTCSVYLPPISQLVISFFDFLRYLGTVSDITYNVMSYGMKSVV